MNLVAALWHLQQVDQEFDVKTKRLDQVGQALAADPTLATSRAVFETEQKKLGKQRGLLQDRELEAKSLDAKIKELNDRLYSGRVSNPKELDGLSRDLEMVKRRRSSLDDQLLELMDTVDQAQRLVNVHLEDLKRIEYQRKGDLEHLALEQDSLTARIAQLSADRERTRAEIEADALRVYDRLCKAKTGRGVAQLRRDSCGACGVTVPTGLVHRVQAGDEIILCSGCGRILAP